MANVIYLFPFVADWIVGQLLFVGSVRAAQMSCSDTAITGVLATWGLIHVVGCALVGRVLKPENAAGMSVTGCLALALGNLAFPLLPPLTGIFALAAVGGIGTSLFFPAFQIFMTASDARRHRSVAHSTGMYTFAWSSGMATGPLVAGFLMGRSAQGWIQSSILASALALVTAMGLVLFVRRTALDRAAITGAASTRQAMPLLDKRFAAAPDLAWLGWLGTGSACLVLALVRAIFPAMAEKELHLPEELQGFVIFLLCMTAGPGRPAALSRHGTDVPFAHGIGIWSAWYSRHGCLCFARRALVVLSGRGLPRRVRRVQLLLPGLPLPDPSQPQRQVHRHQRGRRGPGLDCRPPAGGTARRGHALLYPIPILAGAALLVCSTAYQAVVHRLRPLS